MRRHILAGFVILAFSVCPLAWADDPSYWWERHDQGWFFYEPEPPKPPKPPSQEPAEPPPPQATASGELFTERMQRLGERLKSSAIENPTPENVLAFARYNKAMIDMAGNFALAYQQITIEHPELLSKSSSPMAENDKVMHYQDKRRDEDVQLRSLAQSFGIFFFYSSTCPYCIRQSVYLQDFANRYGFSVKPVTTDGVALPEWPDTVPDNGIGARLGVSQVPAILVFDTSTRQFTPISFGLATSAELAQRLMWITKPVNHEAARNLLGAEVRQ